MFRPLNDLKIKTLATAIAGLLVVLAAIVVTTSSVTVEQAGEMGKTWETFDKGTAAKSDILSNLRGALGYGGMIHNFKNYVLRKDRPRLVTIEENLLDISGAIAGYLALGANQREKDALGTIEEVVGKYAGAVDVAKRLASEGATSHEIDKVVKIDDGPALDALAVLAAEVLAAREASAESVYRSVAVIERFVAGANAVIGTLIGLLIVSCLWFTRSRLVRPLAELGGAMQALAAGDHAINVPALERNNEIGAMAKTIEAFRENAIVRKRAEAVLRETEERFRTVVNNSPTKIHIKDKDGRYLLVNRLAEKLFGVTDEEARGKTVHEIFPKERADAFTVHDQVVLETGQTAALEEEWFHEDGVRIFLTVKFPILDGTGNIAAVGAIGTDITERKRAEAALRESERALQERVVELELAGRRLEQQGEDLVRLADDLGLARDQAEAANRAKSEFLAAMSHELRTPLNAIIGFSEIIKGETFGPVGSVRYRSYAEDINDSGQHLLALINDILDLSKVESGVDELYEENIEVPAVIESVLRLVRPRGEDGGLALDLDIPDDLPLLRGDKRKLKQILANLMTNAIKFTDAGGKVTLRARCRADSGFVFQIIDTGIGIATEDIPKALSRFGQVDGDLDRQYEGTGLGLPLTKALVELHGGCFDLQSQVGVGTTATACFPATRIIRSRYGAYAPGVDDRVAG